MRYWILVLVMTVIGCSRSAESPTPTSNDSRVSPHGIENVIVISIDTLRADHLACYGHEFVKTPNIDTLAKEGVLFTQHFNVAPTTLSSHTSLMTGTYPHSHGVLKNSNRVSDDNVMLAETLKAAGFETAGFIGAAPLGPAVNFAQGFDHYDSRFSFGEVGHANVTQRRANEVTDAVLDWLAQGRDAQEARGGHRDRLFLFVHYFDAHWPYAAPPPFGQMYRPDAPAVDVSIRGMGKVRRLLRLGFDHRGDPAQPASGEDANRNPSKHERIGRKNWDEGMELARGLDAEYCAEITFCDEHLGRLITGLKRENLYENSLIVLTSDHGETMYEHSNFFNHGESVYDTEIHTPLIVRFPRGNFGGRKESRLVSSIDLVPTILELVGEPVTDRVEGESFDGLMDGSLPARAPIFAEATQPWKLPAFNQDPVWKNRDKFQCVRTDRFKYMFRRADQQVGLYDLTLDPYEQNNLLAVDGAFDASLLEDLKRQLFAWRDKARPLQPRSVESQKHLDSLRSLGYVGDETDEDDSVD